MTDIFFERPKEGEPWDVCIIGSGPSSFTASIYTSRGAASTLVIAGDVWGGQLMLTTEVDNFPGFPEGVLGPELMQKMRSQAERFKVEIVDKRATEIDFGKSPFEIHAGDKAYFARSLILATGAETRWLGVPGEEKLLGRGVSSCAPCDAPFFKNKKVAVVGGGDSAMEEALVLTKYASEVVIVHRRSEFRASAAMQAKVMQNSKIRILWNTEVTELIGESKLEKIKLKSSVDSQESEVDLDGVFVAIGHSPATDIYKGKIKLDEKGYVVRYEKEGFRSATSVPGVFVAGDVHDTHYKQAITAAGFGCMAALDTLKYLDKDMPVY